MEAVRDRSPRKRKRRDEIDGDGEYGESEPKSIEAAHATEDELDVSGVQLRRPRSISSRFNLADSPQRARGTGKGRTPLTRWNGGIARPGATGRGVECHIFERSGVEPDHA
jgi:hypothetical protein